MESLVGIVIFLVFVAFSAVAKSQAQREQKQRRQSRGQQWPGPVVGGPNMGFPVPRPQVPPFQPTQFPQPPRPQPQPQPVRPAPALAPAPQADLEGVGMEGPLSESAEAEVSRFDRETAQDIDSTVSEIAREADALAGSDPTSRTLGQLGRKEEAPTVTGAEAGGPAVRLDDLQQAVVMAEVLGRPKGARYFGRSR